MNIEELSGWLGAILVLVAYFMVSTGRAKADSSGFQLINIIGAIFLIYYTHSCKAYASMIVNIMWVFIGLGSLITYVKLKNLKERIININRMYSHLAYSIKPFSILIISLFVFTISTTSLAQDSETPPSSDEVPREELTTDESLIDLEKEAASNTIEKDEDEDEDEDEE